MKLGDLVKLSNVGCGTLFDLRGIVLDIVKDPEGEFDAKLYTVLWCDGDMTKEFPVDLDVVCK